SRLDAAPATAVAKLHLRRNPTRRAGARTPQYRGDVWGGGGQPGQFLSRLGTAGTQGGGRGTAGAGPADRHRPPPLVLGTPAKQGPGKTGVGGDSATTAG